MVIRQKGEPQDGCFNNTKHVKFTEKRTFLTPWCAHPFPYLRRNFVESDKSRFFKCQPFHKLYLRFFAGSTKICLDKHKPKAKVHESWMVEASWMILSRVSTSFSKINLNRYSKPSFVIAKTPFLSF